MQQNIIGRKREINLLEISQEENWNEPRGHHEILETHFWWKVDRSLQ